MLPDVLVLDGGLATELEARGHDLAHPLWSARLLDENPDPLSAVHRAYLEAGADCITTASYQASLPGLEARGVSPRRGRELLALSVKLARDARDAFVAANPSPPDRPRPLVAASVGPYGAYLADGSEYDGRYGLSQSELRDFHDERLGLLLDAGPDLLAIETLPSAIELRALLDLLDRRARVPAWISFSCPDGAHIHDGTPIRECAALCAESSAVLAVGVNCTAPRFVPSLIRELREGAPEKRIAAYPNSGELWDAERKRWTGEADAVEFAHAALEWRRLGASIMGGCCRTGPEHIREIRRALDEAPKP